MVGWVIEGRVAIECVRCREGWATGMVFVLGLVMIVV